MLKKAIALFGLGALISLMLAGCGGGGDTTVGSSGGPSDYVTSPDGKRQVYIQHLLKPQGLIGNSYTSSELWVRNEDGRTVLLYHPSRAVGKAVWASDSKNVAFLEYLQNVIPGVNSDAVRNARIRVMPADRDATSTAVASIGDKPADMAPLDSITDIKAWGSTGKSPGDWIFFYDQHSTLYQVQADGTQLQAAPVL